MAGLVGGYTIRLLDLGYCQSRANCIIVQYLSVGMLDSLAARIEREESENEVCYVR